MFTAFLFHSLLCGCVTLVYLLLRRMKKVSPSVCYVCDCALFLYYIFPAVFIPANPITGRLAQVYEREDMISISLLPERIGEGAAFVREFEKTEFQVLMWGWCVVLACLLIYICGRNLLFSIRMRRYRGVNHWTALNWWKPSSDDSKEVPLFTDRVYTCPSIHSPVFQGVICPRLYFPENMTSEAAIRAISSHHEVHFKRKDVFWKLAAAVILAVHWFNPFAWLLYYCFLKDCEISCGCKAARNMTEAEKDDYLKLLIQYAEKGMWMTAAFGFGKSVQGEMQEAMLGRRKTSRAAAAAMMLCLLCGFVLITGYTYQKELTVEETIVKYLEDPIVNEELAVESPFNMEYIDHLEFAAMEKEPTANDQWPQVEPGKGLEYTKFRRYTVAYKTVYKEGHENEGQYWFMTMMTNEEGITQIELVLIYTKDGWRIHSAAAARHDILTESE